MNTEADDDPIVTVDLHDLRARHPGNPLFRADLRVPGRGLQAYHATTEEALDGIAGAGLRVRASSSMSPLRQQVEAIFADVAPFDASRRVVFAYPALEMRCLRHHLKILRLGVTRATIVLEIDVDAARALVADTLLWNEAAGRVHFHGDIEGARAFAEAYWRACLPLADYHRLDDSERSVRIGMPEVLISPDPALEAGVGVAPDCISVAAVIDDPRPGTATGGPP